MFDMPKRKNDDMPLSAYDQTWLFRLYRWLRWDRARIIHVDRSSENCRQQIERFIEDQSLHRVKTQTVNSPYAFEAAVFSSSAARSAERGVVIGQVIPIPEQDEKSLIVLHAYPGRTNTGCATILTSFTVFALCAFLSDPTLPLAIQILVIGQVSVSFAVTWLFVRLSRNEGLEVITKYFCSHRPSIQEE
jgi:hypothetical protein